ncbi:MAG: transcription termination/antitermination factor NusG [Verrucomicrobia bacterium CG_4_10_14_3_um_filter_43_23]|nr:MAG: transcription termination/antitermination factor NusG [Verrucomicrobia bacterium CG1_02_43_26]PIP59626.1 MAG: transcription termination/antitermination factor NusG [Verrucomicrobia bacterium CG22_combo_CG10-13_8_21_14_all_43_17]PIX58925.1 MAG: transcription termination/antitermination factor NusG [Verrucomicrobia bacterium CG_4_10_14_3_um_filter_43_23]PIY61701.1 MAG: transcription termination/antitermination factor NusG [Verrucomicrobia bacterium CG_4_10_14_0_8_um_filter_43_34]PJA44585.
MSNIQSIHDYRWYAIQTLSNQEGKVKLYLDKFIEIEKMDEWIKEVLVPTETVAEVKAGKKSSRVRKFYPGYAFIHMKLYDEDNKILQAPWLFVKNTQGVINFVGGERPVPLKEDEIDRILSQVREAEGKEVPKVQYEMGQTVKINDGPFLNLTGRIDEIDPERGKLKVSVSIFGRFTPVELEYWQVDRVEG